MEPDKANEPAPAEQPTAPAEPTTPTTPPPAPPDGKGYGGKRPMWQWVVLYLIVGGIVYWLVYALVFADDTSTGGGLY